MTRAVILGGIVVALIVLAVAAGVFLATRGRHRVGEPPAGASVSISSDKSTYLSSEPVTVHVIISNPHRSTIAVLRWFTPIDEPDRSLFTVIRDGTSVSYRGRLVKRAAPTDKDYVMLEPGETITADVNLSTYYQLSVPGTYYVTYDVASIQLYTPKPPVSPDPGAMSRLKSETITILVK